ncbi:hypothetical protein [Pedobacter faecalis]|uniref:hypothetical protein n=1 Tax=Pedobacter faecalis TaxID=3041495 RepID=UPI00254A021A|nr:hypothetical protein [Pedobacter sp. ELA7]
MPVLGAIVFVVVCVMFNIFTVLLFLEALGWADVSFNKEYKLPFAIGLVLVILFYYSYKGRYKRILEKHEKQERVRGAGLHPVLAFVVYYGISFGLMLLAGLYKNGDLIFAK